MVLRFLYIVVPQRDTGSPDPARSLLKVGQVVESEMGWGKVVRAAVERRAPPRHAPCLAVIVNGTDPGGGGGG